MSDEHDPGARPRARVVGAWRPEYAEVMRRKGIEALELNDALGWTGNDIGFLVDLDWLRELDLVTMFRSIDLRPISALTELEVLTLPTAPRKHDIEFSAFPRLRRLGVDWREGRESVFAATTLEGLYLYGYPDPDLRRLGDLRNLERLQITSSRRLLSTEGIGSVQGLVLLGLYAAPFLADISDIAHLVRLRDLAFSACRRIDSLEPLRTLVSLERLRFEDCGEIESLEPIAGLTKLQSVRFPGDTRIVDGDLNPLAALPALNHVAFMNRRTYTHRREELDESWLV